MNAYLENAVSLPEYQQNKNNLVQQKQILKDKLNDFEQKRDNWFEPAIRFVNELKYAGILAKSRNLEEKKDFLKKLGSNFQILNQKLVFVFKNPFKMLADAEPRRRRGEAENSSYLNWRRGRDSNSRYHFWYNCSPSNRTRPLCDLSLTFFLFLLSFFFSSARPSKGLKYH